MRYPAATWQGPVPNMTTGATRPPMGLVLHIMQGTYAGTDAWFHNPNAQASAHFGVSKAGAVCQWVDTDDTAWAQANGNPGWLSVECEGVSGEALTAAQILAVADLFSWICIVYPSVPLVATDNPAKPGLGWHGMGGAAWGNHPDCPGANVVDQRPAILATVGGPQPPAPAPAPHAPAVDAAECPTGGTWVLHSDGGVFAYGAPFFGSYPGLPEAERQGQRSFVAFGPVTATGYVILADDGARYAFPVS